jgi:hypothetical protein
VHEFQIMTFVPVSESVMGGFHLQGADGQV